MFQRDTDPPPPPLPELEYSPGLADTAAPHWDDLSENHDTDRLVSNQFCLYQHLLIFFTQVGHYMTAFFSTLSTHKHSSLWVTSIGLSSNHLFTPCTLCCYRNIILSI
jgi:hypothetical protein